MRARLGALGAAVGAMLAACAVAVMLTACTADKQPALDGALPPPDADVGVEASVVDLALDAVADADACKPGDEPSCVTSCKEYLLVDATCSAGAWSCSPHVGMATCQAPEHAPSVDPFIGTGGYLWTQAMLFPGATLPFGLVRLSPDMCLLGGFTLGSSATAGYHDQLTHTWGFSHTRLSGTGVADGGLFRLAPAKAVPMPALRRYTPLRVDHASEQASPGYYAVKLPDLGVLAELTATTHVGGHRYTFPTGASAYVVVDVSSHLPGQSTAGGKVKIDATAREVSGTILLKGGFAGRYGGLRGYFVARFDRAFEGFGTWTGATVKAAGTSASGDDVGAYLRFKSGATVEVLLGLSFVSEANARDNLKQQAAGKTFATLRKAAEERWNEQLLRVHINTSDADVREIFYTALYHSLIMPTNFTDENGQYLGFKGKLGQASGFTYRTDLSLWDTVRTTHPLFILAYPQIQLDALKSLVRMARIGGTIPRWPSGGGYAGSMFGTPADLMIAESYLKGITGFEVNEAYALMKKTALQDPPSDAPGRDGNLLCIKYGYCPADLMKRSVAATLEYAWEDGAIAALAKALNKTTDAATFAQRAQAYKGTWNSTTSYFQPRRADGTFVTPLYTEVTTYEAKTLGIDMDDYVEGSPRQWRWSVQQDPQGMIALFGGAKAFVKELETFMQQSTKGMSAIHPGPAYWHGNEHDFHAPYLFNEAGRPELTQKWVRWALTKRYSTDKAGLDGNDDGGTLSAWYVLSALGFYPIVGSANYWIGAPIVDSAQIVVGGEVIVTIIVEKQSATNLYVQQLLVDGVKHCKPAITHDELVGATLRFKMGPTPASKGGFDCS
jgi:predicted alpha-1,2-mannosidase